jgi:hypothetical protein
VSAFFLGWGLFWLICWAGLVGVGIWMERADRVVWGIAGSFVSAAWIVGVLWWRVFE